MIFFKLRGLHAFFGELCSYACIQWNLEFSTIEMFSDFIYCDNLVNFGSDCAACGIRISTEEKGYVLASLSGRSWSYQRSLLSPRHRLPILLSMFSSWSSSHEVPARWENYIAKVELVMWEFNVVKIFHRNAFRFRDKPMWKTRRCRVLLRWAKEKII